MAQTIQELEGYELMQAQTELYRHALGFAKSMAINCAVQLGIPDIIYSHGKPMPLSSLVDALSLPLNKTESLNRLMRLMIYSGLFSTESIDKNQEQKGYVLTATSKLLVKTTKTPSAAVLCLIDPFMMSPFYFLSAWFQGSGSTPFEAAHGMTLWNALERNPELRNTFDDAMAGDSRLLMSEIVNEGKRVFENLKSVVDVGGGSGSTAQALVEAFPHLKCIILDLPNVIANLQGATNIIFIGGNMFDCIPSADAVLMKGILHNWNDLDCVKILMKCREAIRSREEGGKVIIIEAVINEEYIENKQEQHSITETQLLFDIAAMGGLGGKERTEKEWEKLFLESGFTGYKIICTVGFRSLIEVYP